MELERYKLDLPCIKYSEYSIFNFSPISASIFI